MARVVRYLFSLITANLPAQYGPVAAVVPGGLEIALCAPALAGRGHAAHRNFACHYGVREHRGCGDADAAGNRHRDRSAPLA
jgi:hypothetical protein